MGIRYYTQIAIPTHADCLPNIFLSTEGFFPPATRVCRSNPVSAPGACPSFHRWWARGFIFGLSDGFYSWIRSCLTAVPSQLSFSPAFEVRSVIPAAATGFLSPAGSWSHSSAAGLVALLGCMTPVRSDDLSCSDLVRRGRASVRFEFFFYFDFFIIIILEMNLVKHFFSNLALLSHVNPSDVNY
jgi:hypothetical protein